MYAVYVCIIRMQIVWHLSPWMATSLCRRKKADEQSMYEKPLSGDGVFVNQSDIVQSSSALLVTLERDSESNKVYWSLFLYIMVMMQSLLSASVS